MIKKLKLPIISMAVVVSMLAPGVALAADVKVLLNGEEIAYGNPAQIVSDRAMAPLSETIEAITGAAAEWDEETNTVTFQANGNTIKHTVGEAVIYIDDEPMEFPTPSIMGDDGALVPVRMLAEASGCNVDWDGENYTVLLTNVSEAEEAESEPVEEEATEEEATEEATEETTTEETMATEAPATDETAAEASAKEAAKEEDAAADDSTVAKAIMNVVPDKETINAGDEVTLAITTIPEITDVWIDCDNRNIDATFDFLDASGNRVWAASCSPSESQRLHIFASVEESGEEYQMEIQYIEVLPAE